MDPRDLQMGPQGQMTLRAPPMALQGLLMAQGDLPTAIRVLTMGPRDLRMGPQALLVDPRDPMMVLRALPRAIRDLKNPFWDPRMT